MAGRIGRIIYTREMPIYAMLCYVVFSTWEVRCDAMTKQREGDVQMIGTEIWVGSDC
jgi:hypothetical protein